MERGGQRGGAVFNFSLSRLSHANFQSELSIYGYYNTPSRGFCGGLSVHQGKLVKIKVISAEKRRQG